MKTDYKKLGLKAGLEIHQQLDTHKLFCSCPSRLRDDKPDIIVRKTQQEIAKKAGKIDAAAAYELKRGREFIYEGYSDTTCKVEFDEAKPKEMNKEALQIALQIALLLNAKPVPVIKVIRKVCIDGSDPAGFQRTAVIAKDGHVNIGSKKIKIYSISLEEDSARIIKGGKKEVVYRMDRLGIPLIEIATSPQIKSPAEAKVLALKIGEILRSCKIKRGIGTIRQDVNLSIKNGARTEIKGAQELNLIPKLMEKEIARQVKSVKSGKKVLSTVRKANPDGSTTFMRPMPGEERLYPDPDVKEIKPSIKGIKLPKLVSEKISDIEKKYALSKELSQQVVKQNIDLENYVKKFKNIPVKVIAATLVETPKELKARYSVKIKDFEKQIEIIFDKLNKNEISKDAILEILVDIAKGKKIDYSQYKFISAAQIENEIKKLVEEKPDLNIGALMGLIMAKFKGKIDGRVAMEILKRCKK